jgi:hypothetical protein
MFIYCTGSPTVARAGLPTQRSHITHIPYSELFRNPPHTHTLTLQTEAARCSETSENPLLRASKAPKMTITTHIIENTSLCLSMDGKHSQFRPTQPNGKGGRAGLCRGTITEPGGRTRGTDENKAGRSCERVAGLRTLLWACMKRSAEITFMHHA